MSETRTGQRQRERARTTESTAPAESLDAFSGWFVPGLCFESGHSIWLYDFTATPTPFGPYREVWVVHPDGERVLYVEPEVASVAVAKYHTFDRLLGGDMVWMWNDERLTLSVVGEDGSTLELRVDFVETPTTRLLAFADRAMPTVVSRTVGPTLRNLGLNGLLRLGGLQTAGLTETGRRYRGEADRILLGHDAEATLSGEGLGRLVAPTRPIRFGDVRVTRRPTFFHGDLWLERQAGDWADEERALVEAD